MRENVFTIHPNCNDVLFSRGFAAREASGTKHFHRLCREHAEEYMASNKQETKHVVAYRIINAIHDLVPPGRFLVVASLDKAKEMGIVDQSFNGQVWQEVDMKTALHKTKHAIRHVKRSSGVTSQAFVSTKAQSPDGLAQNQVDTDVVGDEQLKLGMFSQLFSETPESSECDHEQSANRALSTDEIRHVRSSASKNKQYEKRAQDQDNFPSASTTSLETPETTKSAIVPTEEGQRSEKRSLDVHDDSLGTFQGTRITTPSTNRHAELTIDEKEAANQLLALLTLDDKPKFSEQDALKEAAQMTVEEKIEAAKDVFGKSVPILQNMKRVKRGSHSPVCASSVLQQMKLELEVIDVRRKMAFLEALTNADACEFSNERLTAFLLREDNDPKLAAERFVAYWTERRNVFGPDKYTKPLTLCCALRDDLVALQSQVFQLLPRPDASGRPIFVHQFHYDTREGYTRESLVRVNFYLFDLISQTSGEVVIVSHSGRNATLWDFDPKLGDILYNLEKNCYPVQAIATHGMFTPFFKYAIVPIAFAFMDQRLRSRTVVHDVGHCPESLANYGITKDMLPREMGGTLEIDQLEWIKERIVEERRKARVRFGRSQCVHTLEDALLLLASIQDRRQNN